MNLSSASMIAVATKPYKVVGQPGETVMLLADDCTDPEVLECFTAAARMMDLVPITVIMPQLERDYQDPPLSIEQAAQGVDIIHYLTTTGLVHSQFGKRLSEAGKKRIISESITARMLREGGALAEAKDMREITQRLAPYWDGGKEVHVTTPHGTDFTVGIEGRTCFSMYSKGGGTHVKLGTAPRAQFPGGECPVPPLEYTGQGTIVVDISIHHPHGLLAQPIRMEMKDGLVTDITGGYQADQFVAWLEKYGDEQARRLCEISIGTNPKAIFMGSPRQDRFVAGSFHVGFGMNVDVGGVVESCIHYDGILSQPTVEVDGKVIVSHGKVVV